MVRFFLILLFLGICRRIGSILGMQRFVGAFPFGSAAGAGGFVFVTPDFKVSTAYVAFNVGWFRL